MKKTWFRIYLILYPFLMLAICVIYRALVHYEDEQFYRYTSPINWLWASYAITLLLMAVAGLATAAAIAIASTRRLSRPMYGYLAFMGLVAILSPLGYFVIPMLFNRSFPPDFFWLMAAEQRPAFQFIGAILLSLALVGQLRKDKN